MTPQSKLRTVGVLLLTLLLVVAGASAPAAAGEQLEGSGGDDADGSDGTVPNDSSTYSGPVWGAPGSGCCVYA